MLAVRQLPQHGDTVLAAGGAERSVWGDGDGVDVAGVAVVVGLELALGELPNLVFDEGATKLSQRSVSLQRRQKAGDAMHAPMEAPVRSEISV